MAISEDSLAVFFAVLGVLGSLVWMGMGYYGIRTLEDIRKILEEEP